MEELLYHANKLKNNKKTYDYDNEDDDNFHVIIFKKIIPTIGPLLLLSYEYWGKTADITKGINMRCLLPIYKSGKSKETIG